MTLGDDLRSRPSAAPALAGGGPCFLAYPDACLVHRSGLRRDGRHGPLQAHRTGR
jgi:hypothetical protein